MVIMNGVKQWLFQRVSNAIIVLSGVALFVVLINGTSYAELTSMLSAGGLKLLMLVALSFACLNSVLAGWQIVGDYAQKFSLPEKPLMAFIMIGSAVFFVAGLALIF